VNVRNRNLKNNLHLYLAATSDALLLLDVILPCTFKQSYSYSIYRQKCLEHIIQYTLKKEDKVNSLPNVHSCFMYGYIHMLINLFSWRGEVRRVKPPSICDCIH